MSRTTSLRPTVEPARVMVAGLTYQRRRGARADRRTGGALRGGAWGIPSGTREDVSPE